ncbi:hypothetical protein R1sor_002362 [Riccia sorocarpa]|uniref:Uncharacterized protein n=1 Tax=Riccia sorocarpa TaxID=122646 RepID=A0ABD3H208_9MARC
MSWLLHILMDKVESLYYQCLAQFKVQGRLCNRILEKYALSAIQNARDTPDDHVSFQDIEGRKCRFVKSLNNPDKVHEVVSYDTELAGCTCPHGTQGTSEGSGSDEDEAEDQDGLDLNTPFEHEGEDNQELVNSVDVGWNPSEDIVVEAPRAETPKYMSEEDVVLLVRGLWQRIWSDAELGGHAHVLITDASETFERLIARKTSIETVDVEPFLPLAGENGSLRRKPGFLEAMFMHSTKRANDSNMDVICRGDAAVPTFPRKVNHSESIQQSLDNGAQLSLNLNAVPVEYLNMTPAGTSLKRRK